MANEQTKKLKNNTNNKIVYFFLSHSLTHFYIFVLSLKICLYVFKVDHYSRLCRKHVYTILCYVLRLANLYDIVL